MPTCGTSNLCWKDCDKSAKREPPQNSFRGSSRRHSRNDLQIVQAGQRSRLRSRLLATSKRLAQTVAREAPCRVWQIESDAIVPVETASEKREYAARTIRSQLNEAADQYLEDLNTTPLDKNSIRISVDSVDLSDPTKVLGSLSIDRSVEPVPEFRGGTSQAKAKLSDFLSERLSKYQDRPAILESNTSFLSPYLHFGQISPIEIAMAIKSSRGHQNSAKEAFMEELLIRRELAINFVYYEKAYDSPNCLPDWAADTLAEHESDERKHVYTSTELEAAETHDPAWNAAMIEMKQRGYLHNHLRMYWGKKIIQWTNTTGHAYRTALELNDRYFVDGRDPNSYSNVLWLFGLHDRAHQEREIFGKVRYMSYDGLKRKMDIDQYVDQIENTYGVKINGNENG